MSYCYNSSPLARLIFGMGLLAMALMNHTVQTSFLLLILLVFVLRFLHGSFVPLIRLFKLLRWFLLPIFIVHALFSPGELLFMGLPIPLTQEGIQQGVLIAIRFGCLFLAAMLLANLLRQQEWFALLAAAPLLNKRICEYMIMLAMMNRRVSDLLRQINRQWMLRKKWTYAPAMLISAMRQSIASGRDQSHATWLRWPADPYVWMRSGPAAEAARVNADMYKIILWNSGLSLAGVAALLAALR
jgi:hypothetical protein